MRLRVLLFQSLLSWIGFKDFVDVVTVWLRLMVSILVVVDWVQRRGSLPSSLTFRIQVSILVVVDWVQRHCVRALRELVVRGFQSLLSWIGFKDLIPAAVECDSVVGFQSLLSWIGFKDLPLRILFRVAHQVSILVVVDWVQRPAAGHVVSRDLCVSILVVVDWVQRHSAANPLGS